MRTLTKPGKMLVAAHRGDSYNHAENTMDAFRAAIQAGADMIETDVHLTRDGVLVLIHDDKVDRTTDGHGLVAEMTFEELRRLNAGSLYNPAQIPTLEASGTVRTGRPAQSGSQGICQRRKPRAMPPLH